MSTSKLFVMALYNLSIIGICCYMVAVQHWSVWTFLLLAFIWTHEDKEDKK